MEAHYHFDRRVFTRSNGHSATGGAAYRAAERIYDERTGETFNYSRKKDVYGAEILTPENAPLWSKNRQKLWNKVEQAEKRKDSQVAYGITLALPNDISHEDKQKIVRDYVSKKFVSQGMVADIAFHDFEGKHSHNPHAHIMLTTRRLNGEKFNDKKENSWRPKIAKAGGKAIVDPEQLKEERREWASHINDAYKRLGIDKRADHRSYKERGINRLPQIHMGAAHHIEHPNGRQEPKATRLGDMNRLIVQMNYERDLQHQLESVLEEKKRYQEQLKKQKSQTANDRNPVLESYHKTTSIKPKPLEDKEYPEISKPPTRGR